MIWSEVILLIAVVALLGVPVMGFTLYWIAQLLELKVEERKQRITKAEAEELQAQISRLQAQLDQVRSSEERLLAVEEQVTFMERLLQDRDDPLSLPGPERESHS